MTPKGEHQPDRVADPRQLSVRHAEFDRRLEELRRLSRRLSREAHVTATLERALELLRQGLRDLAADSLDLHHQIHALARRHERRVADPRPGDGQSLTRPARSVARRGRVLLRGIRDRLRPRRVETTLETPLHRVPALAPTWTEPLLTIVLGDGAPPDGSERLEGELRRQTLVVGGAVEWMRLGAAPAEGEGHPLAGRPRDAPPFEEPVTRPGTPFVFTASAEAAALPATSLELAVLELLLEDLLFVRLGTAEATFLLDSPASHRAAEPGKSVIGSVVARREVCSLDGGVEWRAVEDKARREGRWVVGKTVRLSARHGGPPLGGDWAASGNGHWRNDGYLTLSDIPVAPLRVATASCRVDPRPVPDQRPSAVIVLSPKPDPDVGELLVSFVRRLGERFRYAVTTLEPATRGSWEILEAMRQVTPWVLPLGDQTPVELMQARISHLLARVEAQAMIWVTDESGDDEGDLCELLAALGRERPSLRLVRVATRGEARRRAVDSSELFERVVLIGGELPVGIDASLYDPQRFGTEQRSRIRAELGVGGEVLVVMATPLLSHHRPEDFAAVAHRLRDDRRFAFVLAGDGPLAASIDQLARFLELPNLRHVASFPSRPELLAAADVAMSTSEYQPAPLGILGALAMQRPVVISNRIGVAPIIAANGCGRVVSGSGNVAELAAALESLADGKERRVMGERGRRTVVEHFDLESGVEAFARLSAMVSPAKATP